MLERLMEIDTAITLSLNGSNSLFWDGLATTATNTVTWIPLAIVLFFLIAKNNNWKNTGFILLAIGLCILLADQMASSICKPIFHRFRPAQDYNLMYAVDIVNGYRGGLYGFFSSHASNTFSIAIFLSLLIRNKAFSVCVFSWALLNCWTRIYLGVHYFGDLFVGTLWGCFVGIVVFYGFRHFTKLEINTSHRPEIQTSTGYSTDDIYCFISTLILTYIYIMMAAVCV